MVLEESQYKGDETEENIEICSECGSTDIHTDYNRGETICSNCGIVISFRNIDQGPEWRAFTNEECNKRSRVGSPSTFRVHDKGLSTVIDWHDKDAYGKNLTPKQKAQIYRLRKWQIRTRVQSSMDRNLALAMAELERLSSQLGIPRGVKEMAAVLYRRAMDKRLIQGHSIDAMVAAALYAACRKHKVPRKLGEITEYSRIRWKVVARCYRLLLEKLGVIVPQVSPANYIPRLGAELVLSELTQRKAAMMLSLAREKGITVGKDPTGLAAAALYIAAILEGERRTQRAIAKVAHVTEVTIRNRYKELVKELNIRVEV